MNQKINTAIENTILASHQALAVLRQELKRRGVRVQSVPLIGQAVARLQQERMSQNEPK